MPAPILSSPDLAAFLESGVSILVGTRDAALRPECVRGVGARVGAGGAELTVFLSQAIAATAVENARATGRIAVLFARAHDHRSFQVKGRVVAVAPGTARDRGHVERYLAALADELAVVGVPRGVPLRFSHWPCWSVRLVAEAVFVQTPGPGAGAPLHAGAPR